MFKYDDGSEVLIGDNVLLENGSTLGVVDLIVKTEAEVKDFKVAEVGVMVNSESSGLVYLTKRWLADEPLKFVSRARRNPLFKQDA